MKKLNLYCEKFLSDKRVINSIWMILEKGISFLGLIFVISAMIRYIGPKTYGYIALATSIFIIIKSISQIGLDQIYFKHASRGRISTDIFLKNSIILVSLVYLFLSFFIFIYYYDSMSFEEGILFISVFLAYFFSTIDIKTIHLDATLRSKFNVVANIFGLISSLLVRYIIIKFKLPIAYFSIPIVIFTCIPFLFRFYFFRKYKFIDTRKNKINYLKKYSKYLFKAGAPLALSIVSVNIYLQSSNFMLAKFYSLESVGKYAVAVMLAGCWYFLPTTFILSFIPKIYEIEDNQEYLNQASILLRWLIIATSLIVLVLSLVSSPMIIYLYGYDYVESIPAFRILLISYFFSIIGFYFYRLIIKFSGYNFLAKKMFITTLFNLILTYFMVDKYGIIGAAISSLITEVVSNIFLNMFFSRLQIFYLIKRAFLGGKNEK